MASQATSEQGSYSDALAAFKRDCDENTAIARVLRERFHDILIEPVLDVGAGSGEVASLAFPDLTAFLLDLDEYGPPAMATHKRVRGDFMHLDFSALRPKTILFCHSLNNLARDTKALCSRLATSGIINALVVSNEKVGMLEELLERLPIDLARSTSAFHIPVPKAELTRRHSFVAKLLCGEFQTLAQHVVRVLLELPYNPLVLAIIEQHLRSVLTSPQIEIAEAIYCYRLRN